MQNEYTKNIDGLTGNVFNDVNFMHNKFKFHDHEMTRDRFQQRLNFLDEELEETKQAFADNDAEHVVDGLIDLIVVAAGTLDLIKVDGNKAWIDVQKANLSKQLGLNPNRPDSGGIDLMKPEGWVAPSHKGNTGILSKIFKVVSINRDPRTTQFITKTKRYAAKFLEKIIETLDLKGSKYQSPHSTVKSANYYEVGGLNVHLFNIREKALRFQSLVQHAEATGECDIDSMIDTLKDNAAYSAIAAEWIAGEMDGQRMDTDLFGRIVDGK